MPEPTVDAPRKAPAVLSDAALRFISRPGLHAVIASIDPDGSAHQALTWYRLKGSTIVLNSLVGRRWPTNLVRDSRVSVTITDGADWISVRGTVEAIEDQAVAHADIVAMARAYYSPDEAAAAEDRFRPQQRITFHVRPERIHEEFEG